MATCPGCARYLTPTSLRDGARCPFCGGAVDLDSDAAQPRATSRHGTATDQAEDLEPVPWHFKVFLGALALYLGWRGWQLVDVVWH